MSWYRGWGCLTRECGEILALGRGAEVRPLPERKGRRPSWSQDPRRILGRHAEPTGTDGFRVLCRQFSTSSLRRQENCTKSSNASSLKRNNPLQMILLLLRSSNDQGQEIRPMVSPLQNGRRCCVVYLRRKNHSATLPMTMGSRMKRLGVSFVLLGS